MSCQHYLTPYNAVSSLPVVSAVVLLQYDNGLFHGSVALALEVAPHPLLDTDNKTGQHSVSFFLQILIILVLGGREGKREREVGRERGRQRGGEGEGKRERERKKERERWRERKRERE